MPMLVNYKFLAFSSHMNFETIDGVENLIIRALENRMDPKIPYSGSK